MFCKLRGLFGSINTERLMLRPFVESDAARIELLLNDKEIASNTRTIDYPYPEGGAVEWIADENKGTRCLRFAASVTTVDARLASDRWSNAIRRASHPQGHYQRFQISIHIVIFPLRQASWRNPLIFPAIDFIQLKTPVV